jgi:hypothetical protein
MSGWLDLTQLGLAPNQKHQALLGAPKIVHCGLSRSHAALIGAYVPMLATRSEWADLGRFSQLLEETEHFCACGQ